MIKIYGNTVVGASASFSCGDAPNAGIVSYFSTNLALINDITVGADRQDCHIGIIPAVQGYFVSFATTGKMSIRVYQRNLFGQKVVLTSLNTPEIGRYKVPLVHTNLRDIHIVVSGSGQISNVSLSNVNGHYVESDYVKTPFPDEVKLARIGDVCDELIIGTDTVIYTQRVGDGVVLEAAIEHNLTNTEFGKTLIEKHGNSRIQSASCVPFTKIEDIDERRTCR